MEHLDTLAAAYIGLPYIWGGNTPLPGFDCSGLTCEILRAHGLIGREDYGASALFDKYKANQTTRYARGCLAFYGKNLASVSHVAVLLSPTTILEAGGGNSECVSVEAATKKGACVRIRPIKHRSDLLAVCTV